MGGKARAAKLTKEKLSAIAHRLVSSGDIDLK
jgi:hypothetical protein